MIQDIYPVTGVSVEIVSHTADPERVVAAAARLCYSASDVAAIMLSQSDEDRSKLIRLLRRNGHLSTFEHASFTFSVEGMSRISSQQLTRHRIASFSQQSQRYVDYSSTKWQTPATIAGNPEAKAIFDEAMQRAMQAYETLVAIGTSEGRRAESVHEDARFVLPNAVETKLLCTMNARELLHFFELRCCLRAQWEIRDLARQLLISVRKVAPKLFETAGPPCVTTGHCREGGMTCGRIAEVKQFWSESLGDE